MRYLFLIPLPSYITELSLVADLVTAGTAYPANTELTDRCNVLEDLLMLWPVIGRG